MADEATRQADAGGSPASADAVLERRRQRHVWALTLTLAAIAAVLISPEILRRPETAALSLAALMLLPVFGLAEVVVIHLPTLRSAHGHTLREIPAVIGLAFLAPLEYVVTYVAGAIVVLFVW